MWQHIQMGTMTLDIAPCSHMEPENFKLIPCSFHIYISVIAIMIVLLWHEQYFTWISKPKFCSWFQIPHYFLKIAMKYFDWNVYLPPPTKLIIIIIICSLHACHTTSHDHQNVDQDLCKQALKYGASINFFSAEAKLSTLTCYSIIFPLWYLKTVHNVVQHSLFIQITSYSEWSDNVCKII
jgi:hypothetical protein